MIIIIIKEEVIKIKDRAVIKIITIKINSIKINTTKIINMMEEIIIIIRKTTTEILEIIEEEMNNNFIMKERKIKMKNFRHKKTIKILVKMNKSE